MKNLKTDNEIISEIQSGINISENFVEISKRHSAIFYKTASKLLLYKSKCEIKDFYCDKDSIIFKVIQDYKPNKNSKFSTYLANRVKWMCYNEYHHHKKNLTYNNNSFSMNDDACNNEIEYDNSCENYSKCLNHENFKNFLKKIENEKDFRTKKIFQLRYFEGETNKLMPWKIVGEHKDVQLSVQGCINIHNKYLRKFQNEKLQNKKK
jgi:DNA-directed RNA polymerase specialized sigma subunit